MIVAICTDVHGHTARLRAFAAQAREHEAQELWCLGDVVDSMIGAPPKAMAETVDTAIEVCDLVLGGNHDLWALERSLLAPKTAAKVAAWSPVEQRHGVGLVHASLADPYMEWVDTDQKAGRLLRATEGWLAVHGHTHRRRLWAATGRFPHAEPRPTRGTVAAGGDTLLACPGALAGARPMWLLVDLEARRLRWVALRSPGVGSAA